MKDRTAELLGPPPDFHDLETVVRGRIREMIVEILDEELEGPWVPPAMRGPRLAPAIATGADLPEG